MKYKEIFENSAMGKPYSFMSMATTGLKDDDHIVGIWFTEEDGKVVRFLRAGSDIIESQQYHRIPEELYREEAVPEKDFAEAVMLYLQDHTTVTYNTPFMLKFLGRDVFNRVGAPFGLFDIDPVIRWILTNQTIRTPDDCNLSYIFAEVATWRQSRGKAIRKALSDVLPSWEPSGAYPEPFVLAQALRDAWQALGEYPVSLLVSEEPSRRTAEVLHAPPIPSGTVPGQSV